MRSVGESAGRTAFRDRFLNMPISVVIPTYGRPDDLVRCLRALERQDVAPREVIVVRKSDDAPTGDALAALKTPLPLKVEVVEAHQQSVAMNRGVAVATSPIIALTDDDAAPRPDWIVGLEAHHAEAMVGAVGGRDQVHTTAGAIDGRAATVGLIRWYGRCVGNHHLGSGMVRDVAFLKGVNLSVRRDLWQLDERLQGAGVQTHWEMDVSLGVLQRGFRVVYDPMLVVDHYPAARIGSDDRASQRTPGAVRGEAHNEALALLKWLPPSQGLMTLVYGVLIGSNATPGLARAVAALALGDRCTARLFPAALAGRAQAAFALLLARRIAGGE